MRTVGLDFGTHQTKICVGESIDKRNFTYEFLSFKDLDGNESYMLPSVVQINDDETLSYGFVDESRAKLDSIFVPEDCPKFDMEEPIMPELPTEPIPYSDKDIYEKFPNFDRCSDHIKIEIMDCYDSINEMMIKNFNYVKYKLTNHYDNIKAKYEKNKAKYEKALKIWNQKHGQRQKQIFRYFKQASLSKYEWPYVVESDHLCVFYLTNILFQLKKRYGNEFQLQVGIPTGYKEAEEKKNKAYTLVINAFKLAEDYFNNDYDAFLQAKYSDLMSAVSMNPYTRDDAEDFELKVFPEAYANLFPIASNNRFEKKISLIFDIGGGTTDISLFIIKEKIDENGYKSIYPEIFSFYSVPQGLNFIMENSLKDNVEKYRKLTIDSPCIDPYKLEDTIKAYKLNVLKFVNQSLEYMAKQYKYKGYNHKEFYKQLEPNIRLYSGGGYSDILNFYFPYFTDSHIIGFDYFQNDEYIQDLEKVKNYGQILSTAFGLAHDQKTDQIKLASIIEFFDHLADNNNQNDKDYSLADNG